MDYFAIAKNVLTLESDSIIRARNSLTQENIDSMVKLLEELESKEGKLIFIGVGKSGIVAQKLASSFTSLGMPSIFLHPTEALHGDLGLVTSRDLLVFISKSGTTEEIVKLLPFIEIPKNRRVGLLGNLDSILSKEMGINFDCSVEKEACINNQAPTTSTTVALAVGDAIAVVYESLKHLSKEGFAINHPGGRLGKALRIKVKDIMISSENVPTLSKKQTLQEAILEMTKRPLGASVVLEDGKLAGVIVEGDIRRTFAAEKSVNTQLDEIMNSSPITISGEELALDALALMETKNKQITILPVVCGDQFLGIIRLHDLLKEGF